MLKQPLLASIIELARPYFDAALFDVLARDMPFMNYGDGDYFFELNQEENKVILRFAALMNGVILSLTLRETGVLKILLPYKAIKMVRLESETARISIRILAGEVGLIYSATTASAHINFPRFVDNLGKKLQEAP